MSKKIETRQQLAQRELELAKQLSPKQKTKVRKRMRREYGIGDFLSYIHSDGGLVAAVRKVAKEEQLFLQFDGKGKPVH